MAEKVITTPQGREVTIPLSQWMKDKDGNEYLNMRGVVAYLGVTATTAYKWLDAHGIEQRQFVGKSMYVRIEDLNIILGEKIAGIVIKREPTMPHKRAIQKKSREEESDGSLPNKKHKLALQESL